MSALNFRLRIRPRVLRGISQVDLSTTILGERITLPVGIAPTATQKLAHPDGERATARGENTCTLVNAKSLELYF